MRLFGWIGRSERWGRWVRRFRKASTWVPKKNKKSPTLAAWGLYLLAGDGEPGNKVFLGAKDGRQAREIAGAHCVEMCRQSPDLMAECSINKTTMRIVHEPTRSLLQPLSSANVESQKAQEGINGSVLIDETHVVDRRFVNRISRAGISRSEPLHIEVSTAGNDPDSYGRERFDYGRRVNDGEIDDPQTLYIAHAVSQDLSDADLDADPGKFGNLANPAWGHTVGEDEYLADYRESRHRPVALADFKMYRLNVWQAAASPWLRIADWDKCRRDFSSDDLEGQPCGVGLDLGRTEDMTSLALVFPADDPQPHETDDPDSPVEDSPVRLLNFYWLPEAAVERHEREVAYATWQRDGWLRVLPGEVVDFAYVERDLVEILHRYDCRRLHFDEKYAAELVQRLTDVHGFDQEMPVAFPQTIMHFAGPTAQFERLVLAGKLWHDGNPITRWQAGHCQVRHDANDNIRPVKPEHGDLKKIDGIVAGIMALGAAGGIEETTSAYESRGPLYVMDLVRTED
jgi:phage terminase large subunit-like protein